MRFWTMCGIFRNGALVTSEADMAASEENAAGEAGGGDGGGGDGGGSGGGDAGGGESPSDKPGLG